VVSPDSKVGVGSAAHVPDVERLQHIELVIVTVQLKLDWSRVRERDESNTADPSTVGSTSHDQQLDQLGSEPCRLLEVSFPDASWRVQYEYDVGAVRTGYSRVMTGDRPDGLRR